MTTIIYIIILQELSYGTILSLYAGGDHQLAPSMGRLSSHRNTCQLTSYTEGGETSMEAGS